MSFSEGPDGTDPIAVTQTQTGRGVIALRAFIPGQVLGPIRGRLMTDGEHYSDYAMDLWEDISLEPDAPYRYLNHSCEANCELFVWEEDGKVPDCLWLEVIRPVEAGEQLTLDYGWPAEDPIRCECGALSCRGWIVHSDEVHKLEPISSHFGFFAGSSVNSSSLKDCSCCKASMGVKWST